MAVLHRFTPHQPEDVEVIDMSPEEYEAAKRRALDELGVSYEELADQAQRRQFDSLRHRKVWLLIREY